MTTVYERLGGDAGVAALLDRLYVRAVDDPLLAPFFERADLARLKQLQFAFTSQAVGGPHKYSGPSLAQAHAHLRIQARHFDAFIKHMDAALGDLGYDDSLCEQVMSMIRPLSGMIVNTTSQSV